MTQRRVHGGDRDVAARLAGCEPSEILDFSANINPLGAPPGVIEAATAALSEVGHYPHPRAEPLRGRLSAARGCDVVVGNGATELIYAALIGTRHVWAPSPSYLGYAEAAAAAGAHMVAHMHEADALLFGRPNNPDGAMPDVDELIAIAEAWPGCRVVVDESFLGFTEAPSCLERALPENLWVVTSMTKTYAIPGLRLGWIGGRDVSAIDAYLPPWTVSAPALAAGLVCIEAKQWLRQASAQIATWRADLQAGLSSLPGVSDVRGGANFLLVTLAEPRAAALREALIVGARVLIRDASNFAGLDGRHVRVAVRRPEENARLLAALRATV
ncbi:MAG: adenosylcobyric acid synthase [Myxococcota bacterium]